MNWRVKISLGLLFTPLLLCLSARAQVNPNLEIGFKPFGGYEGGEFDSVSMTNGNLSLRIPLFSNPQRGSLPSNSYIVYDDKGWQVFQTCNTILNTCTARWRFVGYGIGAYVVGDPDEPTLITTRLAIPGHASATLFTVRTADGANHQMMPKGDGSQETVDGTGIWTNGVVPGLGTVVIRKRNGDQTYPSVQDTNGNFFSSSGDTIGRTGVAPVQSSDPTGCANGPNPIVAVWISTYPGGQVEKRCLIQLVLQSNFQISVTDTYGDTIPVSEYTTAPMNFIQSIVFYNGTSWATSPAWTFEYNSRDAGDPSTVNYGSLTKITFPQGGTISYTWYTASPCLDNNSINQYSRGVASRTFDAHDGTGPHTWTYGTATGYGTRVTDPDGNQTVYNATGLGLQGSCSIYVTQKQWFQGSSLTGTLLKTENTDYQSTNNPYDAYGDGTQTEINVFPIRVRTIWPNGKTTKIEKDYDSNLTVPWAGTNYHFSYGDVTNVREYDYGINAPGPLLRTTTNTYLPFSNSSYLLANLLNPISSTVVKDGNGTQLASTTYSYDQYNLAASGVTVNHDTTIPNPGIRGNRTSACRWLNTTGGTLCTTTTYFDTGMPNQVTDPGGHTTTYSYSSAYAGAYVTQTTMPDTNSPNLAHHVISGLYDFNTGVLTNFTDQNNQASTYQYDALSRMTQANFPDSGQTTFSYPDFVTIERQQLMSTGIFTDMFVRFDGLGREIRRITKNAEPTPWDQRDIYYNELSQKKFATYPYQGNGLSAAYCPLPVLQSTCAQPGDTFAYDPLGRVITVTHFDGASVATSYTGVATKVSDEGNGTHNVQRVSQIDGLGRLASMCEVSSATLPVGFNPAPAPCGQDIAATGFLTTYGYDALGNLLSVAQAGLNARSFLYDSLSRLTSATNPESGATTYTYNSDSSLTSKVAPAPNQTNPATTVTTTLTYDPIHRPLTKTYSDGTTPAVTLNYDESTARGVALSYTTGRASSAFVRNSQGTTLAGDVDSYDQLGRVKINSQCTPQNCGTGVFPLNYTYDLLGDMLTASNGMGTTLTYSYNAAPRLTGVTSSLSDANHPGTLLTVSHYNAFSAETSATLGSGLSESLAYFPRGWLQSLAVGTSGGTYNVGLTYTPNGNVLTGNDSVNGNWAYAYDDFNRLLTSNKNSSQQAFSYDYDRFGNRWHQNITAGSGPTSSLGFDANNRITSGSGVTYDAAGNVTNDGSHTYTYDAENRIISMGGGAATYVYNAGGQRVRKTTGGVSVDYLYDLGGHVVSEVSSTGGWNRGEVFAGGKHVATYSGRTSGTTYFIHADWLGTERARTTATGAAYEQCTSLPFGDGFSCTGGDPSPLHFTGKQRDTESGLDNFGARYYSSSMGRFGSPDWSTQVEPVPYAKLENPQSLNLYAYVLNNPVSAVDNDGHDCLTIGQFTRCWNPSEFQSIRDAEDAHEAQHRADNKEGVDQPGWRKEQRGYAAEVPILEKRLGELDAKEKSVGLTDAEKKEKQQLQEEHDTATSLTQGKEADRNAQRYYWNNQNRIVKLFLPNPDKQVSPDKKKVAPTPGPDRDHRKQYPGPNPIKPKKEDPR